MSIDISRLELPKVSPSGVRLLEMLASDDCEFKQLAEVVEKDPALAGYIIKYANSPLFHRQSKIINLTAALSMLGFKSIRSAVVSAIMRSQKDQRNTVDDKIWEHSQLISTLCRLIAKQVAPALVDDLQFIGLVHDIGMLMLNHYDPAKYQAMVSQSQVQAQAPDMLDLLEMQAFGVTHDVVSVRVCDQFRFVEQVGQVIGSYHACEIDADVELLESDIERIACILSLAHHIEHRLEKTIFNQSIPYEAEHAMKLLNIDSDMIQLIMDEALSLSDDESNET